MNKVLGIAVCRIPRNCWVIWDAYKGIFYVEEHSALILDGLWELLAPKELNS